MRQRHIHLEPLPADDEQSEWSAGCYLAELPLDVFQVAEAARAAHPPECQHAGRTVIRPDPIPLFYNRILEPLDPREPRCVEFLEPFVRYRDLVGQRHGLQDKSRIPDVVAAIAAIDDKVRREP